jgi:hypothetical protein
MGLTLAVAVFMGMYAPELQAIDKSGGILLYSFVIADLLVFCFTPVWAALLFFRDCTRRGKPLRKPHCILLLILYLLSLMIFVMIVRGFHSIISAMD